MAIKTFSTGEVLTASDTNTYLANAGLVYVTSTTIGSGVSSVTISNCFSSTYDNYRVAWQGTDATNGWSGYLKLNNSTGTTFKYGGYFHALGTAGIGDAYEPSGIGCWLGIMGNKWSGWIDLLRVSTSSTTNWLVQSSSETYANNASGYDTNSAAHTGLTLVPATGTFTGGSITVYGYRKA